MVSPHRLHPAVKERFEPRVSATALAEYMILQADGQENILHDCRFSRVPIVTANADALRAIRSYNCDPRRDRSALAKIKVALIARSQDYSIRPKVRDEARRCAEAITLFESSENSLGIRSLALKEAPHFAPVVIHGVSVSIRPDFLVEGADGRVGAGIVRVAKAPDPAGCKLEETRQRRGDHRRELGRYLVALLHLVLESDNKYQALIDRDLCFVADVRIGERIGPSRDHLGRIRAIRSACRQIATLWPTINPKPSVLAK